MKKHGFALKEKEVLFIFTSDIKSDIKKDLACSTIKLPVPIYHIWKQATLFTFFFEGGQTKATLVAYPSMRYAQE